MFPCQLLNSEEFSQKKFSFLLIPSSNRIILNETPLFLKKQFFDSKFLNNLLIRKPKIPLPSEAIEIKYLNRNYIWFLDYYIMILFFKNYLKGRRFI